jgi:pyridoxine 4-dehydrogenase
MTTSTSTTFLIGGNLPVNRVGFGAMQLTGPGVWGPPADETNAKSILRRAVALGVNFIDTADVYGPRDNERLIREALAPYTSGLVIATKGGMVRKGPATREDPGMSMDGSEAHIREAIEGSLETLGVDRIDLYQLHRIDPAIPVEETMGVFRALRDEGKIGHVGLSQVSIEEIERARSVVEIATVQNVYNLANRTYEDVLAYCGRENIGFIPFWPLHIGELIRSASLVEMAASLQATPQQVVLAWLLRKSPSIVLIPGTSTIGHVEENVAAGKLALTDAQVETIERLGEAN